MCGLKHCAAIGKVFHLWSHPAWVCGLKHIYPLWCPNHIQSHPAWVCGLKPNSIIVLTLKTQSHPAWVCGLKQWYVGSLLPFPWSHPAWVCGLKRYLFFNQSHCKGHTLRGCVDWNNPLHTIFVSTVCHTLRGCVDWNNHRNKNGDNFQVTPCVGVWIETLSDAQNPLIYGSHTLRGCVDWNRPAAAYQSWAARHTLRGCVDWNSCARLSKLLPVSHPAWVCGLKPERDRVYRYKL